MSNKADSLKNFIINCLEEKKAENILPIELSAKQTLASFMIFASGRSVKNIRAIAEYIELELKHKMSYQANVEGIKGSDWVLVDAGEVVVHLFHPEAREKLKLEEFWQSK